MQRLIAGICGFPRFILLYNCRNSSEVHPLKGPKHEIFGSGFFTLIKPIWIGDLGTSTKN
jgi:hypothetical protein